MKDKERETAELRELLTNTKTKIGELQSSVCIIEEKFTTYNLACTGYEQNVQLLEQVQHTLGHLTSQNVITERRTLGPAVEARPYGFQPFVTNSDTSDTEAVPQQGVDSIAQSNGTRYQSMREGAIHYKQKSESNLLEEKSFTIERTSSQPTMRILATETRPRQSSVPPQVPCRTSSASTTDLGWSSGHTRGQQKLHNGMLHRSSYMESESTTTNQYYSSGSDMHCDERDTPSSHFQSAVQETFESRPHTKPKPLTKEKPNMEMTHDLSANSSPTDSQTSQQSDVSAELKSKLRARLKKIGADS